VIAAQLGAASRDDDVVGVMRNQILLKSGACSPGLHAALPTAARIPGVAAALRSTRLNAAFVTALTDRLREKGDPEIGALLDRLIATYDERLREGIDLSHSTFREAFWERTPLAWNDPCERQSSPFYRASWPQSHFTLLCGGSGDISLDVVARTASRDRTLHVRVNGEPIGVLELDDRWRTWRGRIPRALLSRGMNRVTLAWPALRQDEDEAIAAAERRLRIGADADLFPIFGEVYSLRARTCGDDVNAPSAARG
jgi:hypothetical protein